MFDRVRLLVRLPAMATLGWRLFRDPRVPVQSKAIAAGAVALVLSPLDVLDWVPVAGGAGELALIALVLRSFIEAAPEEVREEHMQHLGLSQV